MAKKIKKTKEPAKKTVKSAIGITIDAAQIVAVEVDGKASNASISAKAREFLPKGLVVNGFITDEVKVGEIMADMLKKNGFSNSVIVFGAKSQNVLMRIAPFAKVPDDKMRNTVIFGAQQVLPIPINELVLDCVICDEFSDGEKPMVNALIVGAKKTYLNSLIASAEKSAREIKNIDNAALAAVRGITRTYGNGNESIMVVYLDFETINIIALSGETILMTRTLAIGEGCYKETENAFDSAAYWNAAIDERALETQLTGDIIASVGFFENQKRQRIEKIYICGEYTKIDVLTESIKDSISVPVQTAHTYPSLLGAGEGCYATAASLAISELGE